MRLAWSRPLPAPPVGLCLAREAGRILVRSAEQYLELFDRAGQAISRQRGPGRLVAATIADDGGCIVAAGEGGLVWRMSPDLAVTWGQRLSKRPVSLAVDALGQRIAVADDAGGVRVYDRDGHEVWRATTVRPLVHLTFMPEVPVLVGCADYGLVCAFDPKGTVLWRDGLVAHVGSLVSSGDGGRVVLACFTDGLNVYSAMSSKRAALSRAAPSRLAAIDYRGEVIVTTGLANELARRGAEGDVRGVLMLSANAVAVAVEAMGTGAYAAVADGTLVGVELLR